MRSNKRATKALEEERPAKRRKSQSNDFDMLPDEIIAHILSYSPDTIDVCSRFRNVTRSQSFWRSASQNRWGIDLPINNVGNKKWMNNHGQMYVFPFDGKEVDWQAYYSLRSYFCLLLHEVSEWKEMQRDFPIENSELSSENFQHFFNYIQNFDFNLKPFLLRMLPLFISNERWGLSSLAASYFWSFEFNHQPDLALAKYLLKISQDVEVPELQFEFFKSACVQFYLLQEHNQESKALLKDIVAQLIQYGVEAEVPANVWGRKWEWIYPTVRFKLLNNKSPQLQEMIEYLLDLVIENFHATDDEFHQTSAIGVLQTLIDLNNAYVMPARLIHLAVEALRKESQDVRYAGLVLAVVVLNTKQKIDLDNLEAIFVFDKLIEHAEIRRADGFYDIMQPIFKLVSRYPSDLISSQRIQKFITGCVSTMRIERDFFGNVLKHVKYIPKLALIWKERMPDVKKFKLAFASLKCTTTNTGRMYSSCYIRTGYNALGLKFHDEASQFFEEAFKDPINEELYALCGDVLYDAFKQLGQIEEAENVLATLLKLFVPSVTSSTVQLSPNVEKTHKKIQKRFKKLKKRCKDFDQKDAEFINGLFEDEPEDIQQLTLYNSNVKIVKPDKNAVLREVVKHLLHIATDLKSDPTTLGTRAQILSCCLEYHCQGTFYPKGKIDAINELYEDLIPSLSFEQRSFFAKKVHRLVNIGLSRRINTITSGLMHTKEVDATPLLLTALRSMVLNPATHSELCNLIDCLTGAYNDIFPLPVSFVSLIGLIFSLRSTTESTSAFRDSALSNWVVDTMENGTEDMRNDATRVCAILNSSIESRVFEEILIRLKSRLAIKADDLKNTCKRLLESSSPDISTAYMKEFVDATFLIQSRQIQFDD